MDDQVQLRIWVAGWHVGARQTLARVMVWARDAGFQPATVCDLFDHMASDASPEEVARCEALLTQADDVRRHGPAVEA